MNKFAVIGSGRMGRRHMENIRNAGLDLTGICDGHADTLNEAGDAFDIADNRRFTDAQALLEVVRPECLVVATTAPSHCALVCAAAQAGVRYILCEKPMAVSIGQARLMIEACKKSGALLAVNHQMRFMEQYTLPKSMLDSAAFGGMTSINVTAGNFGLAMNGCHKFELFRYMTAEKPDSVQAWFSREVVPNPRGPQFEDRAGVIRATTASGKRFYLDASADQGHGVVVQYAARNGQITVDELGGRMSWTVRKPEHADMPTTRYGMPWEQKESGITPADALLPSLHVLRALLDEKNYPTGEDGLLAVRMLVAAHLSHEEGHRIVGLDEALPAERSFPWA